MTKLEQHFLASLASLAFLAFLARRDGQALSRSCRHSWLGGAQQERGQSILVLGRLLYADLVYAIHDCGSSPD